MMAGRLGKGRRRSRAQHRGIRPELVKRIALYGVLCIVLCALQCSFFGRLSHIPATPDLLIGAVMAIALLDSVRSAAVFAVAGGFMIDAVGSVGISLSPLLYLVAVCAIGLLAAKMLPSFFSYLLLLLGAVALREVFSFLQLLIIGKVPPVATALTGVILPEALCTLVLCIPVYFLVKLCIIPLHIGRDGVLR